MTEFYELGRLMGIPKQIGTAARNVSDEMAQVDLLLSKLKNLAIYRATSSGLEEPVLGDICEAAADMSEDLSSVLSACTEGLRDIRLRYDAILDQMGAKE